LALLRRTFFHREEYWSDMPPKFVYYGRRQAYE
jgi:hypothetical protein